MSSAPEVLANLAGFRNLDPRAVAQFATGLHVSTHPAGDVLFEQGAAGDGLYVVLEGHVGIGSETTDLARLGRGALVGLVSLAGRSPRTATVVADGDVEVAWLSATAYEQLPNLDPEIAAALELAIAAQMAADMRHLARRVRDALAETQTELPAVDDYDVAVIGGGPVGLAYANFVKQQRPQTRVAVLDRRETPGYKIGESTLAPSVRMMRSLGLELPVIRRLFAPKTGLTWFWAGPDSPQPELPIAGYLEETFQLERSVLEKAAMAVARRRGIHVYQGARVDVRNSRIGVGQNELSVKTGDQESTIRSKIVCDATGPASQVPRHLKVYRKDIDSFNTNAYFGYFRKTADIDIQFFDDATTRHLCFPEGWVWFIDIVSWEQADDDNLTAMIEFLLDHPPGPDESYPSRQELSARFNCPYETIVSIGVVPRSDIDSSGKAPVEDRFQHYVDKYPAFRHVMDHYELIETPYAGHRKYSAFTNMAHDCEQVAGDGWVAIGDSAVFVNPLFSPGLTFGSGTAYMAAQDTIGALSRDDYSRESFGTYEQYARDVFASLLHENELHYRSFVHPDSYESAWMIKFVLAAFQITLAEESPIPQGVKWPSLLVATGEYVAADPFELAVVNPIWVSVVDNMMTVLRSGQSSGENPDETAAKLRTILEATVDSLRASGVLQKAQISRAFRPFDDEGNRLDDPLDPPRLLARWLCQCGTDVLEGIPTCPVCGSGEKA